jgi:hypothetical protein
MGLRRLYLHYLAGYGEHQVGLSGDRTAPAANFAMHS